MDNRALYQLSQMPALPGYDDKSLPENHKLFMEDIRGIVRLHTMLIEQAAGATRSQDIDRYEALAKRAKLLVNHLHAEFNVGGRASYLGTHEDVFDWLQKNPWKKGDEARAARNKNTKIRRDDDAVAVYCALNPMGVPGDQLTNGKSVAPIDRATMNTARLVARRKRSGLPVLVIKEKHYGNRLLYEPLQKRDGVSYLSHIDPETGRYYYETEEAKLMQHVSSPLYLFHALCWAKRLWADWLDEHSFAVCPFTLLNVDEFRRDNPRSLVRTLVRTVNGIEEYEYIPRPQDEQIRYIEEADWTNTLINRKQDIYGQDNMAAQYILLPYYAELDEPAKTVALKSTEHWDNTANVSTFYGRVLSLRLVSTTKSNEDWWEDKPRSTPTVFARIIVQEKANCGIVEMAEAKEALARNKRNAISYSKGTPAFDNQYRVALQQVMSGMIGSGVGAPTAEVDSAAALLRVAEAQRVKDAVERDIAEIEAAEEADKQQVQLPKTQGQLALEKIAAMKAKSKLTRP